MPPKLELGPLFSAWMALEDLKAAIPHWRAEMEELDKRAACRSRMPDIEPPSLGPIVDNGPLRDLDIE